MTIDVLRSVAILGVIAVCTWFTRAVPFLLFGRRKQLPRLVVYLGEVLPAAIMAILVVYCLKSVDLTAYPFGLAEIISVAVVALLHLWKNNTLLSIGGGTLCYMILIRTVFPI